MVSHLFSVVGRIESNLKIDLDLETMCGVDLIQAASKPAKPELNIED
jgi:hypothetical protein